MIIEGDVILKCPKTRKEVKLQQNCLKINLTNPCEHYKHWGIQGRKIVITCTYEENSK